MSLFKRKSRLNYGENEEKPKRELTPEQIAEKEEARKSRKKEIVMIVIGTFISLILTQIFADILEYIQRVQNRRMSAMMVLGNVESFARMLDQHSEAMARNDTVGRWLLAQPLAYLDTKELESVGSMPKATDYYTPQISLDSLVTMPPIILQEE